MINLKIDPEFQSQIPPLTDDEFKQLEENILKEGKLISPLIFGVTPLLMATTVMRSFRNIPKSPSPRCRSRLKAEKKSSHGSAKTSWGGATLHRSRRSSSLESSTVWNIESPVETATTSTRRLPRKPPRRNCVKLTQFLPLPQIQASASRLQSGTTLANPMLSARKSSCGAFKSWIR